MPESIQSMGGIARAKSLSAEERKEIARKAALTRWDLPRATHSGTLKLGDIACHVLETGERVLSSGGVMKALSRTKRGRRGGAEIKVPAFLDASNLKPFISEDLEPILTPIFFRTSKGAKAEGYQADILPVVCEIYLRAREENALLPSQLTVAKRCEILMRGLSRVGITSLVDEATGYQEVRDRLALQEILDRYIGHELAKWAKRFPDEFYEQMFRLKGWEYNPESSNRPMLLANMTIDLVYDRIGPGLTEELKTRRDEIKEQTGKSGHLHRLMTPDVGHPALQHHLSGITFLAKAFPDGGYDEFHQAMDRVAPRKNTTLLLPFPNKLIPDANASERPSSQ